MNGMSDTTGGYDVEFAESLSANLDDIKCAICLLILKEPLQANPCGHRFCKSCIERVPGFGLDNELVCPSDRQSVKVFADIGKEREILNLQVKCTSFDLSCNWTGELRTLEGHLKSCPHAIFPCKYQALGCKFQGNRQQLCTHLKEDIDDHFSLQMEKIMRQENQIREHEIEIAQHQETISQQNNVISSLLVEVKSLSVMFFPRCPYEFVIENFKARLTNSKQQNDFIYSETFYYLNGYRARLKVYLNGRNAVQGTHMSVYFQIMKGPLDDSLQWPMIFGLIKISLIINEKCKHKMAINCKQDQEHLKTRFVKPLREEGEAYGVKYFAHRDLPIDIHGDLIKLVVHVTKL